MTFTVVNCISDTKNTQHNHFAHVLDTAGVIMLLSIDAVTKTVNSEFTDLFCCSAKKMLKQREI
jgi:hypothetical protein